MSDGPSSDAPRRIYHRQSLLGALRRDAEWIDFAPQHIALNQKSDEPVVDLLAGIDLVVLGGSNIGRLFCDGGTVLGRGPAGIHIYGVDGPSILNETGNAVGGIEPARE